MFGILLWSILMARNVSLELLFTLKIPSLTSSKGNKLASGFLFAVLLNFKHIYMYLAVRKHPPFSHSIFLTIFIYIKSAARLLHLPPPFFLLVLFGIPSSLSFLITIKCSYPRVLILAWTIPPYGPTPSVTKSTLPFHSGVESCLLGTQFLGFGHCFGPGSVEK